MTGDELLSRMVDVAAVGIMVSGFADLPAVVRAINEGKVLRLRHQALERRGPAFQGDQGRGALPAGAPGRTRASAAG